LGSKEGLLRFQDASSPDGIGLCGVVFSSGYYEAPEARYGADGQLLRRDLSSSELLITFPFAYRINPGIS